MSFSLMDFTSESTLTDEKLERVFREIEEASERRAREEEEREKDSDPCPLDPVLQALSNTTSLAELKKQRRRQSISVSRVGSHADVPAEFQGPGSPLSWNAPPLYRMTTQTSATSSLSSSSSYISDHVGSNGGGAEFRRHYEEENHTTQKETIAGRRNTLTKAMSTALSRTLTRMRSRGAINEVENEVVIGVAVHEARVETTVEADTVEEGRGNDGIAAEPGAGAPATASLPRMSMIAHIEAVGSSADANSDAGPSRRVSISAVVGSKLQTSALADAAGGRSRSGSIGKLRGILPPLRSQASSNSNSTSTSEVREKDKETKEKEAKEKKEEEKKEEEKKKEQEKEKEKDVKQQQFVLQDISPASISGSGISATALSSGTISGGSGGTNGSGPGLAKEKDLEKNATNGKASKRLSSFAKVLAQRLKRKGSGEGNDSEKKDKEKEKDQGKEKGKKSSDVWDKDNSKKSKSKSTRDSYISISASPLSPTVSSFSQPQQLSPSEILDQPILKSPHLAAPASIPNLKEFTRVQGTEGGAGKGRLGALPPSPRRSPSAVEVPLPASPAGTTTHPLSPRSPASTSSLPVSIAVTSSEDHGRRATKQGGGEDVEPSMIPLPASPTCDAHVLGSQVRICTCGKRGRLPSSALPDFDFGPLSREPSVHSRSGENTPVEGISPLSSPVRTEPKVNFIFAGGIEGTRDGERKRGGEGVEEKENERAEVEVEARRSELLWTEMKKKDGAGARKEEETSVALVPDAKTSSAS